MNRGLVVGDRLRVDAPGFQAKALLRLGQIEAHQKNNAEALCYLAEARKIAVEAGADHTIREIERELSAVAA